MRGRISNLALVPLQDSPSISLWSQTSIPRGWPTSAAATPFSTRTRLNPISKVYPSTCPGKKPVAQVDHLKWVGTLMIEEDIDHVTGDFSGASWRRKVGPDQQ